jgi:hypothetical protein
LALEGGDVVGIRRLQVADFVPEAGMQVTRVRSAAGAFFGPGLVWRWRAGRARGVRSPTADGVAFCGAEQGIGARGRFQGNGATFFAFALLDEEIGSGVWEILDGENMRVIVAVRTGFPEGVWEIAVVRARKGLMAAGAVLEPGFEFVGGPAADLRRIPAIECFEVAGEGVIVDAVGEGRAGGYCGMRSAECGFEQSLVTLAATGRRWLNGRKRSGLFIGH